MDWTPGGISSDVEDRRGSSGGGGGGFGFGGGGLGIVGFLVLLVISLLTGRNFIGSYLSGGGSQPQTQRAPSQTGGRGAAGATGAGEDRDAQLVSFVLDDVQKTWTGIFEQEGKQYRHAKLVLYRDRTYSGCGTAQAATGPFYCPADGKVYMDLGFWDELKRIRGRYRGFCAGVRAGARARASCAGSDGYGGEGAAAATTGPGGAEPAFSGSGAAGGLLRGRLGPLDGAEGDCARERRGGRAEGGGGGWRRPSAEDEWAGGESGELYAWQLGTAANVVQAGNAERESGGLQHVWELVMRRRAQGSPLAPEWASGG